MSESGPTPNQFRDVLYEALAGAGTVRDADPLTLLDRVVRAAPPEVREGAALSYLQEAAIAPSLETALAVARARFETPSRFRDTIYFARCLGRDATSTIRLSAARDYLESADTPAARDNLSTDRISLLNATSFEALWRGPDIIDWMVSVIEIWQRAYIAAYVPSHARFNAGLATIAAEADEITSQAAALSRLNTLTRLGNALGLQALERYAEFSRLFDCSVASEQLLQSLSTSPFCPVCDHRLSDQAPIPEFRRVVRAVQRALHGQQSRLARRAVSRILAESVDRSDKLNDFLRVVQATDLSGLAQVLDDELLGFLAELLEPHPQRSTIVNQLAATYPEVTRDNLDAAVQAFRTLVENELERGVRVLLRGA